MALRAIAERSESGAKKTGSAERVAPSGTMNADATRTNWIDGFFDAAAPRARSDEKEAVATPDGAHDASEGRRGGATSFRGSIAAQSGSQKASIRGCRVSHDVLRSGAAQ